VPSSVGHYVTRGGGEQERPTRKPVFASRWESGLGSCQEAQ
jgi:hypothetical protein